MSRYIDINARDKVLAKDWAGGLWALEIT